MRALAYAECGLAHPGRYRLMFGPDLPRQLAYGEDRSRSRRSFQMLVASIERCQSAGAVSPDLDATRTAIEVWAPLHGLVTLRIDRPHFPWPPLDEMVNEVVGRLLGVDTA